MRSVSSGQLEDKDFVGSKQFHELLLIIGYLNSLPNDVKNLTLTGTNLFINCLQGCLSLSLTIPRVD